MKINRRNLIIITVAIIIIIAISLGYIFFRQQTAVKKTVVIYASLSEMTGADPSIEFSNSILWLPLVYDLLLYYDPINNRFIPGLAINYTHSSDGLEWTFILRKDAKFHDGSPINAEAVKFSIERVMKLGMGPAFIWDPVDRIEVVDDYTIKFYLKYPAPLDSIVASAYGAYIINPKVVSWANATNITDMKINEWFNKGNSAGSGAYRLVKWDPEHEVILEKNPEWWGWKLAGYPLSSPKAPDVFIVKIVKDAVTQERLVTAGEINIAQSVPLEDLESLKNNPKLQVVIKPSFQNLMILFNTKKPPLDNPLVRLAIAHAIPYNDIVNVARSGIARVSSGCIPYGMWGHVEGLTYEYNLTKAKELLAKAGYPNGIDRKLLLTYTAGDVYEAKTAELIKISLSKIGIDLEVRPMSWEEQWSLAQRGYSDPNAAQDILMYYWWPTYITPFDFLFNNFHSAAQSTGFGLTYYTNPEFDRILEEASKYEGIDRAKSFELYRQAQQILYDEAPGICIYDQLDVRVATINIKNLENAINPAYPTVIFAQALSVES